MGYEQAINELREKDAEALAMGGAEKLARRKAEGFLNARERIEYLVDPATFTESGRHARSHRPEVKHKTPADGKIAGFARIAGREVALVSNDFTVLGASSSIINMSASERPHNPELVLKRLEWTVIRRLDGLLHGDYRTLFRGFGLDLADLREYQYHDDVRHIDWNVTARLQTPYVREFNEDREVTAWFLLDLSPSVDFGSEAVKKRGVALDFVTVLARLLTRHAVVYYHGPDDDVGFITKYTTVEYDAHT